jgi:hypothetical protein
MPENIKKDYINVMREYIYQNNICISTIRYVIAASKADNVLSKYPKARLEILKSVIMELDLYSPIYIGMVE